MLTTIVLLGGAESQKSKTINLFVTDLQCSPLLFCLEELKVKNTYLKKVPTSTSIRVVFLCYISSILFYTMSFVTTIAISVQLMYRHKRCE